jgi:LPXTG-motif cell wall-anchored protein
VPTAPPHAAPPPHHGHLAHTGADIGIALGVAGAALLGGLGLRAAARRREEGE